MVSQPGASPGRGFAVAVGARWGRQHVLPLPFSEPLAQAEGAFLALPAAKPGSAGIRCSRARRGCTEPVPSPSPPALVLWAAAGAGSSSGCGEGAVQRVTKAASLARLATHAATHALKAKQAQAPQPLPRSLCPALGGHAAAPRCGTCCDRNNVTTAKAVASEVSIADGRYPVLPLLTTAGQGVEEAFAQDGEGTP